MWKWLAAIFGKRPPEEAATDERTLALEREAQSLRLKLGELEQTAANLKRELERRSSGANARVAEEVQAQVERLLTDAAAPVAQLLTQAHLLEVEGKPVQARDVLAVARRLVRTLEDNGLTLAGSVGETAPFDPNRHEPLSADVSPQPGQPVVVRFVGVAYRGKLLRKAGVEKAEE
jgi:molecular chaperone GrpE (heat shock protein)